MTSTSGEHYRALDHVRALAAMMVFSWHFLHSTSGYPVPFGYAPSFFPLALWDEGHTGVALFMTLSGYLFAKLIADRSILYSSFIWNRCIRLLPLLIIVIIINCFILIHQNISLKPFITSIARGVLYPSLPNGGWSITVEMHFYVILPVLLWLKRNSPFSVFSLLLASLILRCFLHYMYGEVQFLSYLTMIGRFDQFIAGTMAWHWRDSIVQKKKILIFSVISFCLFYYFIDIQWTTFYPSQDRIWIVLPTIEGLFYSSIIAWYDKSFKSLRFKDSTISKFIGNMGMYSYSLYLFHFFYVFQLAHWINEKILPITDFYVAMVFMCLCYFAYYPLGYLSFRFIEQPLLRLRRPYVLRN